MTLLQSSETLEQKEEAKQEALLNEKATVDKEDSSGVDTNSPILEG